MISLVAGWTDLALPVALFAGGVGLLIFSVERLVETLARAGAATGVSPFLLTVLFVGLDFENWAFGIAAGLDGLPGIALGSAVGSSLFLAGVAVPAAGFFVPFEVRMPRDYLVLTAAAPFLLLPFLFGGRVTRWEGGVLALALVAALGYLYVRERAGRAVFRDPEAGEAVEEVPGEGREGLRHLALSALLVVGVVAGSELAVRGARGLVGALGVDETAFGMTVVGLVMSLEEVLLVVEPVRRGRISIAAGNLLGSLLFFATGNVGVIAVVRELAVAPSVLHVFWPFLAGSTLLVTGFLARGRVGRAEALLLSGAYVGYWVVAY